MAPTSTLLERSMSIWLLVPNVATSPGPFGTVLGIQLVAVFQSPVAGFRAQVALSARATSGARRMPNRIRNRSSRGEEEVFMRWFYSDCGEKVKHVLSPCSRGAYGSGITG